MDAAADHVKLQLPQAPQTGQGGNTQGRSKRELGRGRAVTQVCCTTLKTAGVSSAQDETGQRLPTEVRVQAAADVQGERPRRIKL